MSRDKKKDLGETYREDNIINPKHSIKSLITRLVNFQQWRHNLIPQIRQIRNPPQLPPLVAPRREDPALPLPLLRDILQPLHMLFRVNAQHNPILDPKRVQLQLQFSQGAFRVFLRSGLQDGDVDVFGTEGVYQAQEGAVPVETQHVFGVSGHGSDEDLFIAEGGGEYFGALGKGGGPRDQERVDHEDEEQCYEEGFGPEEGPPEGAWEYPSEHGGGGGEVWRVKGRGWAMSCEADP